MEFDQRNDESQKHDNVTKILDAWAQGRNPRLGQTTQAQCW